jgi:hypothetical protein
MICGFEFFDLINARTVEQKTAPFFSEKIFEATSLYCTFIALLCKSLMIHGAGEGNRTLVSALGRPYSTIEPHPLCFFHPNCSLFLGKFEFAMPCRAVRGLSLLASAMAAAGWPASPVRPRAGLTRANYAAQSSAAWLAGRAARARPAICPRRERRA